VKFLSSHNRNNNFTCEIDRHNAVVSVAIMTMDMLKETCKHWLDRFHPGSSMSQNISLGVSCQQNRWRYV